MNNEKLTEDLRDAMALPLHKELDCSNTGLSITRVFGGWLYRTYCEQPGGHYQCSSVFVPFPTGDY